MKVLLIYYTGTYNTRFLTNIIAKRFLKIGYEVQKLEINSKSNPINVDDYDYIGFGYPIYGFNAPHPFLKYLKKLNFKKNQKYFIYKNSGETFAMNNASSRKILYKMKKNKALFCGEYHFVMPYNIHFEFPQSFIRQLIVEDKKLIDIMFYNLANNIAPKIKSNIFYNIGAFFVSIQAIGGDVNSFFYKIDKHKCNKCGLCIKNCPHDNIILKNNKIKFKHSCDMCMRCSFYCPNKAIRIGFLQGWQVNKYYNLDELWYLDTPFENYITDDSKGFYKCFIKTFKKIDEDYLKIK